MVSFFGLKVGGKKRKPDFRKLGAQPGMQAEHLTAAGKDGLLGASIEVEISGCFRPRDANPPRPSTARAMKTNSIFEHDAAKLVSSAASMQNLCKAPQSECSPVDKPKPVLTVTTTDADLNKPEAVDVFPGSGSELELAPEPEPEPEPEQEPEPEPEPEPEQEPEPEPEMELEPWDSPTLPTARPQSPTVRFGAGAKIPMPGSDEGGSKANGALVIGDEVDSVLDAVMASVARQETQQSELEGEHSSRQRVKPLHRAMPSDALPPPGPPPQGSLPSCPVGRSAPRARSAHRGQELQLQPPRRSPSPNKVVPMLPEPEMRPVVQKVKRTKRDTFALCSPRRHSLSMKMEELERRLDEVEFHPVSDDSPDTTRPPSVSSVSDYGEDKLCSPQAVSPPSPLHMTPPSLKSKPLPPVPVEEEENEEEEEEVHNADPPPPIPERAASRSLFHGPDSAGGASPSDSENGVASRPESRKRQGQHAPSDVSSSNGSSASFPFRPPRWAAPTPPTKFMFDTPDPDGGGGGGATATIGHLTTHDKAAALPLTPDSGNWPLSTPVSPLTTPTPTNAGGSRDASQMKPKPQQYHWPRPVPAPAPNPGPHAHAHAHAHPHPHPHAYPHPHPHPHPHPPPHPHPHPSLAPPALQRARVPPPLNFGFFSRSPSGGARGGGLWITTMDSMPSHEAGPGPDLGGRAAGAAGATGLGIHMSGGYDQPLTLTPAAAAEAKVKAMGPAVWMTGRDVREHSLVFKRRPDHGLHLSPTGFADNFGTQFI